MRVGGPAVRCSSSRPRIRERKDLRRSRRTRLLVVAAMSAGSALLVMPASAHSSTYCGHYQSWTPSGSIQYGVGYLSYRDISAAHIHKYRHWRYYPSIGQIQLLHGDVEKMC